MLHEAYHDRNCEELEKKNIAFNTDIRTLHQTTLMLFLSNQYDICN